MPKVNMRTADFVRCAYLETKMWRAYYNHSFIKLAYYLLISMRTAFQCSWLASARLAWYGGKAAMTFRLKKGHENYEQTLKDLVKFYKVGSDNSLEPFDYRRAAELELEWWDIHRYPTKYDKTLEQSLADAAAVVYHCKPEDLGEYAVYRARAAKMLTHESDKHPKKNDWPKIDDLLYKTWQSFSDAVGEPAKG